MKISELAINIDMDNVALSDDHSAFLTYMYIKSKDFIFPSYQYKAIPGLILRWLLREMRLMTDKNNTLKERHIYFYPEDGNYIFLEYIEKGVLCIKFVKRKVQKVFNVFHTVFSKEEDTEMTTLFCMYNDFFVETYKQAEMFYEKFKDNSMQGGEMLVLEQELRYSKKLFNKIIKSTQC